MFCILLVCLSFMGCSTGPTQSEYQKMLSENSKLQSQVSALEEKLKETPGPTPVVAPTPTPAAMKSIEFQGVQLSIPENWEEYNTSDENSMTWRPYSDIISTVILQLSDMGEPIDITDPLYKEAGITSIASSYEDYTERYTDDVEIDGRPGFLHGFYGTVSGVPMSALLYGVSVGNYWFFYISMIEKDSDSAIREEFSETTDQVIASVSFSKMEESFEAAESKSEPEPTPTSAPTPSVDWKNSGMYKVGEDIPAGTYYFENAGNSKGYYAIYSDSTGDFDSLLHNDNVPSFTFLTVSDGQYLEVTRGKIAPADQISAIGAENGKYGSGTYRVGIDIPAGEYNAISDGSRSLAYYAILSDVTGGLDSIVSNDNFENNAYVTVSDGQYLELNGAYIEG